MKTRIRIIAGMVSLAILVTAPSILAQSDKLVGVWKIAEAETFGNNPQKIEDPQPGILIFTRNHFSWVDNHGAPLPEIQDKKPTLAYFAAAFDQLTALSGSYEVKGSTIAANIIVSKDPKATSEGDTLYFEYKFEGDLLVLTLKQFDLELKMMRIE